MAEASATKIDIKDLMQCGICLMDLQLPKALPCLHSFCLKCLTQWAKGKTSVTCPLCVQDFEIPSGGISSFRTNFFINTLKEREETTRTIQSKNAVAPCASCESLESLIKAHCSGCKGFICGDCVDSHTRIKTLKDHKIIPCTDLQSGKVNIRDIYQKKHCKIHEDQVLKFYCETCEKLVCLECTVVDHAVTSHTLVNLESAARGQKTEIEQLLKNCDDVKKNINESLENVDVLSDLLIANTKKAEEDIDEAFHNAVKLLENNRNKVKNELKTVVSERQKQISAEKDPIKLEQTRLSTAMQMATEVLQKGSDYDLAQVYSLLKSNLTALCNLKPRRINKTLGDVSFKPTTTSQRVDYNLGSISSSHRGVRKGFGIWKIHNSFGNTGNDKLVVGKDITITPENNIIVTDFSMFSNGAIKSYETSGTLKSKTIIANPWNIKLSRDGRVFVTNCTKTINVYNQEMTFQQQFQAKSPGGVWSDSDNTELRGLALDNNGMLLVGERNQKYISKHRLDGSHVMSFKVSIQPYYISVSSQDNVIVSSMDKVHILDEQGNHLHTVKPPLGLSSWNPYGVCCTAYDEIYISNWASPGSIDIYSAESGDHIGCLTKDVTNPTGLALMDDEDKLVVVEHNNIKILQREE